MSWRDHTFLMTDVQGSTALWDRVPEAMAVALARHDEIVADVVSAHHGRHVKARGEGDSTFNVFLDPVDAVGAAADLQRRLHDETWPDGVTIASRMSLHVGPAQERADDFYGPTVNRCARIRGTAHGRQVVMSDAVANALPDAFAVVDRGVHRLPDLTEPERLHELVWDAEVCATLPPLRTLDVTRHNLPVLRTTLVGRDGDLWDLVATLSDPRLVTVVGPGGSGKTRLALQVAAEMATAHPDGTWFVSLASVTSPAAVAPTILAPMDVTFDETVDPVAALAGHLRDRRVLLVLDNCEHLLDQTAGIVARLLSECPDLRVLATSQAPLGIASEVVRGLEPLDSPREDGVHAVRRSPSVQLFVERARLVDPSFDVTDDNAAAVARVCRRLDGIPLAIELAAARLRHVDVATLDGLLEDRFRVLTGGPRTAPDRHRTMEAAIDWSHDLLDDELRELFAVLGVFAGSFSLDAAVAVATNSGVAADPFDGLMELVDRSLVATTRTADGVVRYFLLESLRAFARDRLADTGRTIAVADDHLDWLLTVYDCDPPVMAHYDWNELDELRQAVPHALRHGRVTDAGRLSPRLEAHLFHAGAVPEAVEMLRDVTAVGNAMPHDAQLESLVLLADDLWHLGDREGSATVAERARAMAVDGRDDRVMSRVGVLLGKHAWRRGRPDEAVASLVAGVAAARRLGRDPVVLNAQCSLAWVHRELGDHETAARTMDAVADLATLQLGGRMHFETFDAFRWLPGEPDRALVAIDGALQHTRAAPQQQYWTRLLRLLVRHAVGTATRDEARQLVDAAVDHGTDALVWATLASVAACRRVPGGMSAVLPHIRALHRAHSGEETVEASLRALAELLVDECPQEARDLWRRSVELAAPPWPDDEIAGMDALVAGRDGGTPLETGVLQQRVRHVLLGESAP